MKSFFINKNIKFALKLIFPVVVLVYWAQTLDFQLIKSHIIQADLRFLLASLIVISLRNVIGGYRCSVLLKYNKLDYPVMTLSKHYFIGNFFNLFLPAVVGRDIVRGFYLYTSSSGKKETITSIVLESFIGLAALVLLSVLSVVMAVFLGFDTVESSIVRAIFIAFGICCIFAAAFFYVKTDRLFDRLIPVVARTKFKPVISFFRDVMKYNKTPVTLWYILIISFLFQLIGVISIYLLALSLGSTTTFINFLILLPIIWVISMLPVSINGLGVREVSFVFLFDTVGMVEEMAVAICVFWILQTFALGLIGAVLFIFEGKSVSQIKEFGNVSTEK